VELARLLPGDHRRKRTLPSRWRTPSFPRPRLLPLMLGSPVFQKHRPKPLPSVLGTGLCVGDADFIEGTEIRAASLKPIMPALQLPLGRVSRALPLHRCQAQGHLTSSTAKWSSPFRKLDFVLFIDCSLFPLAIGQMLGAPTGAVRLRRTAWGGDAFSIACCHPATVMGDPRW
jgi:hypothetical protein